MTAAKKTGQAAADGNSHAYVWNAATDKVVGSYAGSTRPGSRAQGPYLRFSG
jgi:hypothetical protein